MNIVTFNLNRTATVKLSELGVKTLSDYRCKHGEPNGTYIVANNAFEAQVWELMMIFGPVIYHGAAMSPFVENVMSVDLESL